VLVRAAAVSALWLQVSVVVRICAWPSTSEAAALVQVSEGVHPDPDTAHPHRELLPSFGATAEAVETPPPGGTTRCTADRSRTVSGARVDDLVRACGVSRCCCSGSPWSRTGYSRDDRAGCTSRPAADVGVAAGSRTEEAEVCDD
jgi:hypothetical protein